MPEKYRSLSIPTPMCSDDSQIPDRISAITPSVVGTLTRLFLPNADIRYLSGFYSETECGHFINLLNRHKAENFWDRFGKGRFVVQWSNPPRTKYVFSSVEYTAHAFPPFVDAIRKDMVKLLSPIYGADKCCFNYCVCNLYVDGLAGVNWHTDAEPHLVKGCPIACVSFGSERVLSLTKIGFESTKTSDINIRLESGSVLVMAGETQQHYLHSIAKERVHTPRFSLTFRVNYT